MRDLLRAVGVVMLALLAGGSAVMGVTLASLLLRGLESALGIDSGHFSSLAGQHNSISVGLITAVVTISGAALGFLAPIWAFTSRHSTGRVGGAVSLSICLVAGGLLGFAAGMLFASKNALAVTGNYEAFGPMVPCMTACAGGVALVLIWLYLPKNG